MFQAPAPAENPGKFQRITQIPHSSPTQSANYAKFAPFINYYRLRFRCLTSGRECRKIPANEAKFARFAPISREFRTLRTKLTHMLLTFKSLTIAREPREIGANQQDSAQFAPLLRELREFRAFRSRLTHV